jgi:argininosuccinate lyase
LQEDKERLFDTADTIRATVRIAAEMLRHIKVNRAACRSAGSDPVLLATDLADYLVRKGLAFRPAHHVVGALVALAERNQKPLDQLTLAELQSVEKKFGSDALRVFDLAKSMSQRNLVGAPGTRQVSTQLARWRKALA